MGGPIQNRDVLHSWCIIGDDIYTLLVFMNPISFDCALIPGLILRPIPAGTFMMGDREEGALHRVSIKGLYMAETVVTCAQYDIYCASMGITNPAQILEWGGGDIPQVCVSWNETKQYIQWLNDRLHTDKPLRLPSEAEWEYCCRAGTTTSFSWGDEIEPALANYKGCGSPWDNKQAAPVRSFPPNQWGLYEMHGNVWEMVEDHIHSDFHAAPCDGSAWVDDSLSTRVMRGGGWNNRPASQVSSTRFACPEDIGTFTVGFRLACDV